MTVITSARDFADKVKGVVMARFQIDQGGNPIYEQDEDDRELRHYSIFLSLESPRSGQIDTVNYYLDDETFMDPLAASDNPYTHFQERINSYGDVEVETTVQIGADTYKQRAWLSDLLKVGHAGDQSPAIRDAINRIESH